MKFLNSIAVGLANTLVSRLQGRSCRLSREEWRHVRLSFSQFGEEQFIIDELAGLDPARKVYVDAGAFDPILFSNTLALRRGGWRGIHLEMDPARFAKFRNALPEHHNVNCALSAQFGVKCSRIKYAVGETDKLIPRAPEELTEEDKLSGLGREALGVFEEEAHTLDDVIQQSPHEPEDVAFVNIDCEGHDLEVLKGLDLSRCRPDLIAIECHTDEERVAVDSYLGPHGYTFHAWFRPTAFFKLGT